MKTIIASLTASLTLLTISLSYAKEPDDLAAILKETQVTEKILEGALREELRRDTRVTSVAAEFIAPQGVVVAISLNTPWLRYDERGEPSFEFHGNITRHAECRDRIGGWRFARRRDGDEPFGAAHRGQALGHQLVPGDRVEREAAVRQALASPSKQL